MKNRHNIHQNFEHKRYKRRAKKKVLEYKAKISTRRIYTHRVISELRILDGKGIIIAPILGDKFEKWL